MKKAQSTQPRKADGRFNRGPTRKPLTDTIMEQLNKTEAQIRRAERVTQTHKAKPFRQPKQP